MNISLNLYPTHQIHSCWMQNLSQCKQRNIYTAVLAKRVWGQLLHFSSAILSFYISHYSNRKNSLSGFVYLSYEGLKQTGWWCKLSRFYKSFIMSCCWKCQARSQLGDDDWSFAWVSELQFYQKDSFSLQSRTGLLCWIKIQENEQSGGKRTRLGKFPPEMLTHYFQTHSHTV